MNAIRTASALVASALITLVLLSSVVGGMTDRGTPAVASANASRVAG